MSECDGWGYVSIDALKLGTPTSYENTFPAPRNEGTHINIVL